jgi:hypothetical protein
MGLGSRLEAIRARKVGERLGERDRTAKQSER